MCVLVSAVSVVSRTDWAHDKARKANCKPFRGIRVAAGAVRRAAPATLPSPDIYPKQRGAPSRA